MGVDSGARGDLDREMHPRRFALLALLLSLAVGCDDKGSTAGTDEAKGSDVPAAKAGDSKKADEPRKKREKKDPGEASMKLGGVEWTAERAKARVKGNKVTIKASRMDNVDGKISRQELHLQIDEAKGPGDYVTGFSGSRFIGVGFDTEKMKKATEEGKETAAAVGALKGASHMMLSAAKVHIDSMNEHEIVGTFSWAPPKGMANAKAITDGKFRAVVRKPRKK